MVTTLRSFVMAFCLIVSFTGHAAELSEKQVRDFIAKFESAVLALDVDSVGASLSDDLEMTANVTFHGVTNAITMNKQEYLLSMEQNLEVYSNYTYTTTGLEITLLGNNKANVKYNSLTSMTVQGRAITADSKESATVELINGKVLVTEGVMNSEMKM